MTDTRIAYSAHCTWWDSIQKVGKIPGVGLPCCPVCKSVLFEMPDEAAWFSQVDAHEARGHPGYRKMVEFGRGKHFTDYSELQLVYEATG